MEGKMIGLDKKNELRRATEEHAFDSRLHALS
jgi:hypothetical protein